jgi:hypothetical protein
VLRNWGNLHNGEVHNLCSSTTNIRANNLRKIGMCGECSRHGKDEICIKIFVENPKEKLLRGLIRRWNFTILRWILKKGLESSGSVYRIVTSLVRQ